MNAIVWIFLILALLAGAATEAAAALDARGFFEKQDRSSRPEQATSSAMSHGLSN